MNLIAFRGPWIGQHHLIFNQEQLEDEHKFSDYKIQESTIVLLRCQTVFLVSIMPGTRDLQGCLERIRLDVTGSETIGNLKVRLWDGGLIPPSKKIQSRLGLYLTAFWFFG